MGYLTTADEWWETAGSDAVRSVLSRFLPFPLPAIKDLTGRPTPDNLIPGTTVQEDIERCLRERDVKMYSYCHAAWDLAPDVPGLHEIPGWGVLCDLCSEGPDLIMPEPEHKEEELWDADPECKHEVLAAPGGGIKCRKCGGWFCY